MSPRPAKRPAARRALNATVDGAHKENVGCRDKGMVGGSAGADG